MKKLKVFLVALVATLGIMVASCSKDVDLVGQTYTGSLNVMFAKMDISLSFLNKTDAMMVATTTMTWDGETETETDTVRLTYTFDGEKKGILTSIDEPDADDPEDPEDEDDDDEIEDVPFVYSKSDKTITISFPNEDDFGVKELVLKKK